MLEIILTFVRIAHVVTFFRWLVSPSAACIVPSRRKWIVCTNYHSRPMNFFLSDYAILPAFSHLLFMLVMFLSDPHCYAGKHAFSNSTQLTVWRTWFLALTGNTDQVITIPQRISVYHTLPLPEEFHILPHPFLLIIVYWRIRFWPVLLIVILKSW